MKTLNAASFTGCVFAVITALFFALPGAFAQEQVKEKAGMPSHVELVSSWLVTIEGETQTRTLRIKEAVPKPDGTFLLEATYGLTTGSQSFISATVAQSGQTNTLLFVTQPGSRVTATQTSTGVFEGTFTYPNGTVVKNVRIQKISESDLLEKVAIAKAHLAKPLIVPPAADVPADCAGLSGHWTGVWGYGIGQQWLWVTELDVNCVAKFAYLSHAGTPSSLRTAQVQNGRLQIPCGSGGTCTFEHHGNKLYAHGTSSDGTVDTIFEKIQ